MGYDVFICYDRENEEAGNAIYHILKDNNIKSWIRSKHFSSGDDVDKIVNAIGDSKCFLLILSKHSKDTNYIITETDIAFSRNVPIVTFNLDDYKMEGNLEFILENQTKIPSFPNSRKQLEKLVRKTSEIVGKPADKVKVDSKYVGFFEKINPRKMQNNIKKYAKIAIPIVVALALIYFFVILPTGQNTTDDGVFSMNVTDVEVNGLNYIVHGESFNLPSDATKYFMNIKFFDSSDNLLFEVNSTADEFKSGIIWQGDLPSDNVTHVGFKLTDLNGNVLSKEDYVIK